MATAIRELVIRVIVTADGGECSSGSSQGSTIGADWPDAVTTQDLRDANEYYLARAHHAHSSALDEPASADTSDTGR